MLIVERSRGNMGVISIDYSIVYLPAGVSDGDPEVVTLATGSIQLQGGQSMLEFSVTISNDMFLETGGVFRATITDTNLVDGGKCHVILYHVM